MSALYIHIPFCTQRCIYCDFHSGTDLSFRSRYISSLCSEIGEYASFFNKKPIRTIYLGGGTPSLLSLDELKIIFQKIESTWDITHLQECTIECNPDDITENWLNGLRAFPINRISIGVQSFVDSELKWLNRRHNAAQAIEAVKLAKKAGFDNISIDLIYSLPIQTIDSLKYSLDVISQLDVQHLSAYTLMYEEGSKLTKLMLKNQLKPLDDEVSVQMFELVVGELKNEGFERYEISNYSKSGYKSKHNSTYWQSEPYLGIGAAAHSFDEVNRFFNIANTLQYCELIEQGRVSEISTVEYLTDEERFNDYIFTALRTSDGLNLETVLDRFGEEKRDYVAKISAPYINNMSMVKIDNRLIITDKGLPISDAIMSDFMLV
ncbi:MAG: radical SAM family heme chaperone HemW [bacterium]